MCKLCETKPVYEFSNKRKVCARCFIKYFEKKFLYTIRKYSLIQKNDRISIQNKKDVKTIVLKHLLEIFSQKSPVQIIKTKATKIAQTENLDSTSYKFIKDIFNNKTTNLQPKNKNIIQPLYLFSTKEILLYAKLKKLKFSKEKTKTDKLNLFVDSLEKKHLEIKNAIVNSYSKIYN